MRLSPSGRILIAALVGACLHGTAAGAQVPDPPEGLVFRDPFIAESGSLTVMQIDPPESVVFREPFLGDDGRITRMMVDVPRDVRFRNPFIGPEGDVMLTDLPAPPPGLVYRAPFLSADGEVTETQIEPPEGVRYREPFISGDGIVTATPPGAPDSSLRLQSVVPNPFNPSTQITFRLTSREAVTVAIYDAAGRRVRTLHAGVLEPDLYVMSWDGTDDAGDGVASGVYFVQVKGAEQSVTAKATLVK